MKTIQIAFITIAILIAGPAASFAASPTLDEVVRQLSDSERTLRNIMVVGKGQEELLKILPAGQSGTPTKSEVCCQLTLWHDGLAGGPTRIDVLREVAKWLDGAAPFCEMSYSAAYDGVQGKYIQLKGGPAGHTSPASDAELFPSRPPMIDSFNQYSDGRNYSTFFYADSKGKPLSAILLEKAKEALQFPDGFARVFEDKLDNIPTLKIQIGRQPYIVENWWLDPARGYCLLRYVHEYENSTKQFGLNVVQVIEAGKGIWYPQEAFFDFPPDSEKPADQPHRRWHYIAGKIVANDPKFDNRVFKIAIPPGYRVEDKATGKRFVTTGPTTQALPSD